MNKNDSEIRRRILGFLRKNKYCTVATVTPEGFPDAAFVYYIVRDNFELIFITQKNTDKYKNLQVSDNVTVTVVDPASRMVAKIKGHASLAAGPETAIAAVKDFVEKMNEKEIYHFKVLPLLERHNGPLALVRISPASIRMTEYGEEKMAEEMIIF
jgi:uncharacterized protein YhbP (UPF0306 family)